MSMRIIGSSNAGDAVRMPPGARPSPGDLEVHRRRVDLVERPPSSVTLTPVDGIAGDHALLQRAAHAHLRRAPKIARQVGGRRIVLEDDTPALALVSSGSMRSTISA